MIHFMGVLYFAGLELPPRCLGSLFIRQSEYQLDYIRRKFHKNRRNNKHQVLWAPSMLEGSPSNSASGVASHHPVLFFQAGFSVQMTLNSQGWAQHYHEYLSLCIPLSVQYKITKCSLCAKYCARVPASSKPNCFPAKAFNQRC